MKDYEPLHFSVHLMGCLLGKAIKEQYGSACFDRIETIRKLSKSISENTDDGTIKEELLQILHHLDHEDILPVTRAFAQFLNLSNIAEQYHEAYNPLKADLLDDFFKRLKDHHFSNEQIHEAVEKLDIELVLTAHPTEITRRTLIQKYVAMTNCLHQIHLRDNTDDQYLIWTERLQELIYQSWHTNEMRESRPTPLDEVKWCVATIEESLWQALPNFMRHLDHKLLEYTGYSLSNQNSIIRFASWMGGDRDGNPNVTTQVTKDTLLFNRMSGAHLYLQNLDTLSAELSMNHCNATLREQIGPVFEPYRVMLAKLKQKIQNTIAFKTSQTQQAVDANNQDILINDADLLEPLQLCFDSLCETGLSIIAKGLLLDLIYRVRSFGLSLVRLDIRQESSQHQLVLSEIVAYLDLGNYDLWSEQEKQDFLLSELLNKRPLLPFNWRASEIVQDIINTFELISSSSEHQISYYIISMAKQPSDILAVILLLKEYQCTWHLPVVPLFETLADLNHAADNIKKLLAIDWYRDYIDHRQVVMIGYSDSAKDAGQLAAAWAQYQAMESLTAVCKKQGVQLTLFHGRGGTVGRGGLPAHDAVLSQPPGSVNYRLRVTEQGEMIQSKYGFSKIAENNFALYTVATLEASLLPPPIPQENWCIIMDELSDMSWHAYRNVIDNKDEFMDYFASITPEKELGALLIGSRPARRKPSNNIDALRAIPWIFAWNQCRFMLPVWLGASQAFNKVIAQGNLPVLKDMAQTWPFFKARIEMLEMVFLKLNKPITEHYEQVLVPSELHVFGHQLRTQLTEAIEAVFMINDNQPFMLSREWEKKAIKFRNSYAYPLHLLQAELLRRLRTSTCVSPKIILAMMMTIAGIAAGIRNTG
ncbi:MAG: phosphoenolpyruvate carboxylase [Endozoicomonadaceae bacterium]|nr:phosphoenolpyruvate carboxylase [Endozoicomonadaceae bacterium]